MTAIPCSARGYPNLFFQNFRAEGGELFDRVVKYGKYAGAREQEFKVIFYQLLEAVKVISKRIMGYFLRNYLALFLIWAFCHRNLVSTRKQY